MILNRLKATNKKLTATSATVIGKSNFHYQASGTLLKRGSSRVEISRVEEQPGKFFLSNNVQTVPTSTGTASSCSRLLFNSNNEGKHSELPTVTTTTTPSGSRFLAWTIVAVGVGGIGSLIGFWDINSDHVFWRIHKRQLAYCRSWLDVESSNKEENQKSDKNKENRQLINEKESETKGSFDKKEQDKKKRPEPVEQQGSSLLRGNPRDQEGSESNPLWRSQQAKRIEKKFEET